MRFKVSPFSMQFQKSSSISEMGFSLLEVISSQERFDGFPILVIYRLLQNMRTILSVIYLIGMVVYGIRRVVIQSFFKQHKVYLRFSSLNVRLQFPALYNTPLNHFVLLVYAQPQPMCPLAVYWHICTRAMSITKKKYSI